jgi:exopolysaccharide biosynthesis polyprenyl glycosylphosphotransferase
MTVTERRAGLDGAAPPAQGTDPRRGAPAHIAGERRRVVRMRVAVDLVTTWLCWTALLWFTSAIGLAACAAIATATAACTVALTARWRGYSRRIGVGRVLQRRLLMRADVATTAMLVVVDQLGDLGLGTLSIVVAGAVATLAQQIARSFVERRENRLHRSGRAGERVLVVCEGDAASDVLALVDAQAHAGWRIVGVTGSCPDLTELRSFPHLGASAGLVDHVRDVRPTVVMVSADALRDESFYGSLLAVRRAGIDVHVHAGLRGVHHRDVHATPLGHDTILYLDHPRLLGFQRAMKRSLDVVIASAVLVVMSPVLAVTALAIKLEDSGPVLFRQCRIGRDGTSFSMPKLRSMHVDAEQRLADLAHLNQRAGGPLFKIDRDPRVTRVGRITRATSLDELPQLISVIRGDMSLIGPRPALPAEVALFDSRLACRHDVRPGVTGLWQVEARDDESFDAYRRLDLFYVENWSLLLDLAILLQTLPTVLARGWRALGRPSGNADPAPTAPVDGVAVLGNDELLAS